MTWPNAQPKFNPTPAPNGGYQAVCPTCRAPVGAETKDQEKARAMFANHWKKVHAAEGIPPAPKL